MPNRVQPGGRVDEQIYEQFRRFVQDCHGAVRGNLGTELENAMRAYMNDELGNDQLTRIENDLATVKAIVAEAEADGGAIVPNPARTGSQNETTHTHGKRSLPEADRSKPATNAEDEPNTGPESEATDEERNANDTNEEPEGPPHPKASRAEKAAWLTAQYEDDPEVFVPDIAEAVERVYAFGEDATERLVEAVVGRLDLEPHPANEQILVLPERREQLLAEEREDLAEQAEREADDLDAGHPENTGPDDE